MYGTRNNHLGKLLVMLAILSEAEDTRALSP